MRSRQSRKLTQIYHDMLLYSYTANDWVTMHPNNVGDVKYSIRTDDHQGWLICDGRSISRTTYSELFEIIGTTYGNNDSLSFKLPDCRGRVLGAIGTGVGLTARSAGTLLGAETHALTTAEMPSHNHGVTDPGHTHTVSNTVNFTGSNTPDGLDNSPNEIDANNIFNTTSSSSQTGITIQNTGDGGAHNNMQPTAFLGHVFIYAKINVS
jgi:microcystin-dependent protein